MIRNRRKYARRRRRQKRLIYSSGVIVLMILLAIFVRNISKSGDTVTDGAYDEDLHMGTDEEQYHEFYQEAGTIESNLNEENNIAYSMHYPRFEQENINIQINELMDSIINDHEIYQEDNNSSHRDMLYVNYDSYLVGDNIASIVFYVEFNSAKLANPEHEIITKIYDLTTGEELSNSQLFQGEYLEKIASYCDQYFQDNKEYKDLISSESYQEGIAPTEENYQNTVITKKGILINFKKYQLFPGSYGEQFVLIPYEEMKDYLTFDYESDQIEINNPENEAPNVGDIDKGPIQIDKNKPMVALTFDDGPNPSVTNRILDILKEHNSRATFFVVGNRLKNYPDTLRRIVSENSEIGSHTYQHKSLPLLSKNNIISEITRVDDILIDITGAGANTLRPPYGSVNDVVKSVSGKPLINWSVDTEDWKSKDPKKIAKNVLDNVQDGDIILLHDLYETTAEAVDIFVPKLIEQGYQIVTVSELFEAKDMKLEPGNVYFNAR